MAICATISLWGARNFNCPHTFRGLGENQTPGKHGENTEKSHSPQMGFRAFFFAFLQSWPNSDTRTSTWGSECHSMGFRICRPTTVEHVLSPARNDFNWVATDRSSSICLWMVVCPSGRVLGAERTGPRRELFSPLSGVANIVCLRERTIFTLCYGLKNKKGFNSWYDTASFLYLNYANCNFIQGIIDFLRR